MYLHTADMQYYDIDDDGDNDVVSISYYTYNGGTVKVRIMGGNQVGNSWDWRFPLGAFAEAFLRIPGIFPPGISALRDSANFPLTFQLSRGIMHLL